MEQKLKQKGFTLTELIIVILISAILAKVAIGFFVSQARQGRRIDATNTLLAISLAEERYRSNNTSYGSLAQVWNSVSTTAEGYYTIAISGTSATGYTITATATGDQANDAQNGTTCTPLSLVVSNGAVTKSPAVCWPT